MDNAVSKDGNTVISISNTSKNDIFTAASNQSMVIVYLNEERLRWDDHPYFIMHAESGIWTGRIGKQSGAWAIQEINEFASLKITSAAVTVAASGTFAPPSPYNNANNYTFINAYASDNNLYDIRVRIDSGYYYCIAYQTNGSVVASTTINVTFVVSKKN